MFVKSCRLRIGTCQAYQSHSSNHPIEYLQGKNANVHIVFRTCNFLNLGKNFCTMDHVNSTETSQRWKHARKNYPTSLYAANVRWSCLSFPPLFHSRVDSCMFLSLPCFCTCYRSIPTWKKICTNFSPRFFCFGNQRSHNPFRDIGSATHPWIC